MSWARSAKRASVASSDTPQPTRTLGRNSVSGGLSGSTSAGGLRSTRHLWTTNVPSGLVSGAGTFPCGSIRSLRLAGVIMTNSLRQ